MKYIKRYDIIDGDVLEVITPLSGDEIREWARMANVMKNETLRLLTRWHGEHSIYTPDYDEFGRAVPVPVLRQMTVMEKAASARDTIAPSGSVPSVLSEKTDDIHGRLTPSSPHITPVKQLRKAW